MNSFSFNDYYSGYRPATPVYGVQPHTAERRDDFYSKVAGVTFDGRQRFIPGLRAGQELEYRRDRYNPYDGNAVGLYDAFGNQIGFLSREVASQVASKMDAGKRYRITVSQVTGGGSWSYGVNIHIQQV